MMPATVGTAEASIGVIPKVGKVCQR